MVGSRRTDRRQFPVKRGFVIERSVRVAPAIDRSP
jgi:hypothetical protein